MRKKIVSALTAKALFMAETVCCVCERNHNLEKEENGDVDQLVIKQFHLLMGMMPVGGLSA